jgi:integrase
MGREKARLGRAPRLGRGDKAFGQFFLEWLDYAGAEWAPKTREVNRYHADRAIVRFGHVPLSKITIELLDQEQRYLLTQGKRSSRGPCPLSPKSVKETFTLVKAALRQAKKWNYIGTDPGADLDVPTLKRRHKLIPREDQLRPLLQSASGTRDYAVVVFAAASGCRRGEILALRIEDVDFETGEVEIKSSLEETKAGLRVKPTKSEKPRRFTLPSWAVTALREHLAVIAYEKQTLGPAYHHNGLLFPARDGSYQSPNHLGNRINYLLKKSGLQTTLHGLRHFHASWLLSKKHPCPSSASGSATPIQLSRWPSTRT